MYPDLYDPGSPPVPPRVDVSSILELAASYGARNTHGSYEKAPRRVTGKRAFRQSSPARGSGYRADESKNEAVIRALTNVILDRDASKHESMLALEDRKDRPRPRPSAAIRERPCSSAMWVIRNPLQSMCMLTNIFLLPLRNL